MQELDFSLGKSFSDMSSKRKERPLTRDEMIERGKTERTEQWLHGEPQFMALPKPGGSAEFFAMNQETKDHVFIIFLGEATVPDVDSAFLLFQALNKRYVRLPFVCGFVIPPRYPFTLRKDFYTRFEPHDEFKECFLWLDPTQEISRAFSISSDPTISVFHDGKEIKRFSMRETSDDWSLGIEEVLQNILREHDPGLPLPKRRSMDIPPTPTMEARPLREGLSGAWVAHLGGALSSGPGCKVSFPIDGFGVRLIIDLDKPEQSGGRVLVRWNGENVPEEYSGADIKFGLKTQTLVEIDHSTGVYEVLKSTQGSIQGTLELEVIEPTDFPVVYFGTLVLKT
jgi:hypothetical protein